MSYTPTNWDNGDVITAEKLNKIEQGISEASSGGSGGENFIVHLSGENLVADKTFGEIAEEFAKSGLVVFEENSARGPIRGFFASVVEYAGDYGAAIAYPGPTANLQVLSSLNDQSERSATDYPFFKEAQGGGGTT